MHHPEAARACLWATATGGLFADCSRLPRRMRFLKTSERCDNPCRSERLPRVTPLFGSPRLTVRAKRNASMVNIDQFVRIPPPRRATSCNGPRASPTGAWGPSADIGRAPGPPSSAHAPQAYSFVEDSVAANGEHDHVQKAKDRSRISRRQGQDENNDLRLFAEQIGARRNYERTDATAREQFRPPHSRRQTEIQKDTTQSTKGIEIS